MEIVRGYERLGFRRRRSGLRRGLIRHGQPGLQAKPGGPIALISGRRGGWQGTRRCVRRRRRPGPRRGARLQPKWLRLVAHGWAGKRFTDKTRNQKDSLAVPPRRIQTAPNRP
jgi:hypothetical protein